MSLIYPKSSMSVLINAVLFGEAGSHGESGPQGELNFLEVPKSHLLVGHADNLKMLLWAQSNVSDDSAVQRLSIIHVIAIADQNRPLSVVVQSRPKWCIAANAATCQKT
jgi:hypothetical protein